MQHVSYTKELCSKLKDPQREERSVANSMIISCKYPSIPHLYCVCVRPKLPRIHPHPLAPQRGCGPPWILFKGCWWLWEMIPLCKCFPFISPFASKNMLQPLSAEQIRMIAHQNESNATAACTVARSSSYAHFHLSTNHLHYNQCFVFPSLEVSFLKMLMNRANSSLDGAFQSHILFI